jgi:DNA-binding NarL/FixJ family response regulator
MGQKKSAVVSGDRNATEVLSRVLRRAGFDAPICSLTVSVSALARYAPHVVMIDFDHLCGDQLESVRQIRFVLPNCAIAVVSSNFKSEWARTCHFAGASGVISGSGTSIHMTAGLQRATLTGCYTDPAFAPKQQQGAGRPRNRKR